MSVGRPPIIPLLSSVLVLGFLFFQVALDFLAIWVVLQLKKEELWSMQLDSYFSEDRGAPNSGMLLKTETYWHLLHEAAGCTCRSRKGYQGSLLLQAASCLQVLLDCVHVHHNWISAERVRLYPNRDISQHVWIGIVFELGTFACKLIVLLMHVLFDISIKDILTSSRLIVLLV